jgi:hypothetical protein
MRFGAVALTLALLPTNNSLAAAPPGRAVALQANLTPSDLQRLQDTAYDASRDISQLRSRDTALSSQLQADLDDARDEIIYLKVKLRKNEPIDRNEYAELRDRIENIRSRARGEATGGYTTPYPAPADRGAYPPPERGTYPPPVSRTNRPNEVPVGTEFDVRLQTALSSSTAQVEDRFEATTMVDLMDGDRVLVPAGSTMRGVVSSVNKAGHVDRKGKLNVVFDQVTVRGRSYPIRATVEQALESEGIRGDAGKIGTGAGVGAILGAILGGAKGALAGILVGGGGVIAATEGKDVELPPGTVLRVRLDSPLVVR